MDLHFDAFQQAWLRQFIHDPLLSWDNNGLTVTNVSLNSYVIDTKMVPALWLYFMHDEYQLHMCF